MEFQKLYEFINAPFGEKNFKKTTKYDQSFYKLLQNPMFRIHGFTKIDEEYLIHIRVPSESNNREVYDVVILFFTDSEDIMKERILDNYYIKFFSNSPGFIYKYAALYKAHGYLIESLYDKTDAEYIDTLPKDLGKDYTLFCDKTIYCACRYLQQRKFTALSKFGIVVHHKKSPEKFFQDISTFKDTKLSMITGKVDKEIDKEIAKTKEEKKNKSKKISKNTIKKKVPVKSTASQTSIKQAKRIVGTIKKGKIKSSKHVGKR